MVPINEAMANNQRLLILGGAGSGKTTLLQWVAVRSASQTFEDGLANWNDTIPFFIRLRQCVEAGLPNPEEFPGLVVPTISGTMPDGWAHEQLKSGRALILIDGVDEVTETQRPEVQNWLRELVENYESSRFIITSRYHAIEGGWMEQEGFEEADLQPMELNDIYNFIDHWHNAMREALLVEDEKEELDSLAKNLKKIVGKNRPIRNLATTPLLCSMICALHRDRHQQLPSDRIELYEAGCSMLLERRDLERRLELRDYPKLSYRQKRVLLQDFAYWMLKNNWSLVSLNKTDERFALRLKNMDGIDTHVTGEDIRKLFVERSGMIREPVTGQIDFTHRTFQEFLSAQAALDEGDIGILVNNAHDDQWREVVILAAGLAGIKLGGELIKDLLSRGDNDKKMRYRLHLLGVSSLETSVELEAEVKEEVQKRLAKLVPPTNFTQAKELAAAGDLAIPYLIDGTKYNARIAAACVRCLILIGSDLALDAIEKFSTDKRLSVAIELVKGWNSFNQDDYSARVLTNLSKVRMKSLDGVEHLDNVQSLEILNYRVTYRLKNLRPLRGLIKLKSLELFGFFDVEDISPIGELKNLTSLNLDYFTSLSDISAISKLTKLHNLRLLGFRQVDNILPLMGLNNLSNLLLSGFEFVKNLSPLANLTNLTKLNLSNFPNVTDVGFLSSLSNLKTLFLDRVEGLDNLHDISKLGELQVIAMRFPPPSFDFRPLLELDQLFRIWIFNPPKEFYLPKKLPDKVHVIHEGNELFQYLYEYPFLQ